MLDLSNWPITNGAMLAAMNSVNFRSPLTWGIMIGWIMTVVLHEFAHGVVGWWGGDYTVKERGGLTLNPFQYVDPVFTIILPIVFLAMGGIPLPGGVTYVRRDLLRIKYWSSAVSLAGPLTNFLIFLVCVIAIHPRVGWVDYTIDVSDWSTAQQFAAAMAFLQMFAVILNLIPIPPLDGFGAISPFLPYKIKEVMTRPQVAQGLFIGYFVLLSFVPIVQFYMDEFILFVVRQMGIRDSYVILQAFGEIFRR